MNTLITNDDGIAAPGLRHLAAAAHHHGLSVVVAAPRVEASGTSASLTAMTSDGRVMFERTELPELAGVPAFSVAASPAYIVVLAGLGAFGPPPKLVLSGVNRGANAGHAILHSGTVGAALTAANNGARAMAVSLDVLAAEAAIDDERHWSTATTLARRLLPWLIESSAGTVLNLNVPDRAESELAGVRHATLASFGQVQMAVAERGSDFVRTAIQEIGAKRDRGTDVALLAEGYATISPIRPPSLAGGVPPL